jgi:pyridoxine 4-dehydrogenase
MSGLARRTLETITIGGDLVVTRLGYGAMQLTGPGVWGEYPDRDAAVDAITQLVPEVVESVQAGR